VHVSAAVLVLISAAALQCGADFVKVQQAFPANVKPTPQVRD
jgi:hypothetical protein